MLFFQVALLAGYGYAHLLTLLPRKTQGFLHVALLLLSLLFLPVAPNVHLWTPAPTDYPILKILNFLLANIGVPYLLLAATAPLLQSWFVGSFPGRSHWRLYALSNGASLLALFSYPFVVEPNLSLARQASIWSWGFCTYAFFCTLVAFMPHLKPTYVNNISAPFACASSDTASSGTTLTWISITLWLLLSACGSSILLATTNQLCQEVAVIPFLWVTPLSIYLLTFIICFNSDRLYNRMLFGILYVVGTIVAFSLIFGLKNINILVQIPSYLAALFTFCMVCHGELTLLRPNSQSLTVYYLVIAVGGALGGLFSAVIAPCLFSDFVEYPLLLSVATIVIILVWFRAGVFTRRFWLLGVIGVFLFTLLILTWGKFQNTTPNTLVNMRNFYGVLRVISATDQWGKSRILVHGRVKHGWQYTTPEYLSETPTAYFGPDSGVGLALRLHPRRLSSDPQQQKLRVGVIGLGVGTLASYGRDGDYFRFYEINPDVIAIAKSFFSYIRLTKAKVDIIPGDARVMLDTELKQNNPQHFDVLVVDAFSSDAVPIHLLTRECFSIYRKHMNPDGLLVVNITNLFLDLEPVVRTQGREAGFSAVRFSNEPQNEIGLDRSAYMVLYRNSAFTSMQGVKPYITRPSDIRFSSVVWTDDYASLWSIIKPGL